MEAVTVRGNTICDFPVVPYFTIDDPTFTYQNGTITATGKVTKITTDATKNVTDIKLYVGTKGILVNSFNSIQTITRNNPGVTAPVTLTASLNSTLSAREYVFVKLGIAMSGIQERFYSPVVKLMLNNKLAVPDSINSGG